MSAPSAVRNIRAPRAKLSDRKATVVTNVVPFSRLAGGETVNGTSKKRRYRTDSIGLRA
jgi:hypothetical protein